MVTFFFKVRIVLNFNAPVFGAAIFDFEREFDDVCFLLVVCLRNGNHPDASRVVDGGVGVARSLETSFCFAQHASAAI